MSHASRSQEVGRGGIIIPDTAKEKPQEGQVVAVGNGMVTEDGEYVIMREDDVFAILD